VLHIAYLLEHQCNILVEVIGTGLIQQTASISVHRIAYSLLFGIVKNIRRAPPPGTPRLFNRALESAPGQHQVSKVMTVSITAGHLLNASSAAVSIPSSMTWDEKGQTATGPSCHCRGTVDPFLISPFKNLSYYFGTVPRRKEQKNNVLVAFASDPDAKARTHELTDNFVRFVAPNVACA
jgi:hypothetical protein